jgi:predicted RNase H-like HicB family nuclease
LIDLRNSLIIEATKDPAFFCFYSEELEGFTGVGYSVEDCLLKAKFGMEEFVEVLQEEGVPIPPPNADPQVLIHNAKEFRAA